MAFTASPPLRSTVRERLVRKCRPRVPQPSPKDASRTAPLALGSITPSDPTVGAGAPRAARAAEPASAAGRVDGGSPFACVSCGAGLPAPPGGGACGACGAMREDLEVYVDFLGSEDGAARAARLAQVVRTQAVYETRAVAEVYERKWRAKFEKRGFPCAADEATLALAHARVAGAAGGRVLDVSCGPGVLTREIAAAGAFQDVVGLDVSAAMLAEAAARADPAGPPFALVRADVAAMPFRDAAFDTVVAGAALHCWPRVEDGLAEVARVLRDGGALFASTFLAAEPVLRFLASLPIVGKSFSHRTFAEEELVTLFKDAGFSSVKVEVRRDCALVRCVK